ncbi:uncharacterized protein [Ptychodera flava]|uniref:uncharacterized protein n=1 Tax=Ptychodera flava TaxID=63121 RepID=UPI00396AA3F5
MPSNNRAAELDESIQSSMPSTAAFYSSTASNSAARRPTQRKEKSCAFCRGPHYPNDCTVVTDSSKRHDIVKQNRLCFNCLGKHKVGDCKSKGKCRKCDRKHHTSLCKSDQGSTSTTSETSRDPTPTQRNADASPQPGTANASHAQPAAATTQVHFATSDKEETALLKTAVVPISSGRKTVNAVVLIDEGSNRSFIARDSIRKLNIKPDGYLNTSIATLGDLSQSKRYETATFKLHTRDGPMEMSALIAPKISAMKNFIKKPLVDLPHLRGLPLAHPPSDASSFEISVLIGADRSWDFIENEVIEGPDLTL